MAESLVPNNLLSDDARAVVWRIFGPGNSPVNELSSFDLIEPVVRKWITSSDQQHSAIELVRGWFEVMGGRRRLRPDLEETVAVLILEGIGTDRSEAAVWAISSIKVDLAVRLIRSQWSQGEVDSFVEAALVALETICGRDEVLDGAVISPYAGTESSRARIPRDAVRRDGRLETFRHLRGNGYDLVFRALHPSVGALIGLIIELEPGRFSNLVERLDHPVMQARAAYLYDSASRAQGHRHALHWITQNSCDDLIALAIVYTLETVNALDQDLSAYNRLGADRLTWRTELRAPNDDLDAAAHSLVNDLVDRLAMLKPLACARWLGELLSNAPYHLGHGSGSEIPLRIEQLERKGTEHLVRLVHESWSEYLLAAMFEGLRLTPRSTWPRHLAEVAWEVRDAVPERAKTLALATLGEHDRYIDDELQQGRVYLNWDDWHCRQWITGLGCVLALSSDDIDLLKWISARCRDLPLSVWDAEESHVAFSNADRAAQSLFLVALHGVAALKQIDRAVEATQVRALAEVVWNHCHFAGQYLGRGSDNSVALEFAARSVVEFGEPSHSWLLEQARNPKVGPRALWGLLDERNKKSVREGEDAGFELMIVNEITRAVSGRFGDAGSYDFDSLVYWGHLWLLLGASEQAFQTAKAILAFPERLIRWRGEKLVLELIAVGVDAQNLDQETRDYIVSKYQRLWPAQGYVPKAEREDRQRIDQLLERIGISAG